MSNTVYTRSSEDGTNAAGWIIAIALILAITFFGVFVWPGMRGFSPMAPADTEGTDIYISVPEAAGARSHNPNAGGTE